MGSLAVGQSMSQWFGARKQLDEQIVTAASPQLNEPTASLTDAAPVPNPHVVPVAHTPNAEPMVPDGLSKNLSLQTIFGLGENDADVDKDHAVHGSSPVTDTKGPITKAAADTKRVPASFTDESVWSQGHSDFARALGRRLEDPVLAEKFDEFALRLFHRHYIWPRVR